MSVKALNAVFEHTRATGAAWQVLVVMADWSDHNGWCYPSYSQISKKARISRAMVPLAIETLIELGELQRQTSAHHPAPQDDDDPIKVRSQRRNLYRILLVKPLRQATQSLDHLPGADAARGVGQDVGKQVVKPSDHQSDAQVGQPSGDPTPGQDDSQVVQLTGAGSPTHAVQVVQSADAHIRNSPSGDPSGRPSATDEPAGGFVLAAAVVDSLEAFREGWNAVVADPIKPVHTLTKKRRRMIRARLVERPLEVWRDQVFPRIAESSFCQGQNTRGFIASFDWVINSPDPAVKALEGVYDDRFSDAELQAAAHRRFFVSGGGCAHDPTCESVEACIRKWALRLRAQQRTA